MNLTDAIAAYRLTRLVTADDLLVEPRDAVVRWAYKCHNPGGVRSITAQDVDDLDAAPGGWSDYAMEDDNPPKLATLVTCRWCAGFWCAALVVFARRYFPRAWAPLSTALAYSAGAALLARLED